MKSCELSNETFTQAAANVESRSVACSAMASARRSVAGS